METKKKNWIFIISFAFTLIFTLLFGYFGKTKEMSLIIIAGFIGMAFSHIDKIELFKAPGFEAKMKMLEKTIEEATLTSIRKVATTLSIHIIDLITVTGRYGVHFTWGDRKIIYDKLISELNELGVGEKEVVMIEDKSLWNQYLFTDHLFNLVKDISDNNKINIIQRRIFEDLSDSKTFFIAPSEEFRKLFEENGLLTPEVEEAIEDLQYFKKNKKLRRPEIWF